MAGVRNYPKNISKAALVGVLLAVVAPQDTPKGLGMGAFGCLDALAEALFAILAPQDPWQRHFWPFWRPRTAQKALARDLK